MTDFVIEHIRERLRRLASQQDMLTCEHMLEGADEIERLELLAVNRLIEIDRLLADRDAERKIYNDAIARHLAEIKQLTSKLDALSVILELRWQDVERLEKEVERLTGLLAEWENHAGPYKDAEIERLSAKIKVIEEAALAAYRYHMLGYKDAGEFNANVMLDHMNKLGEVL